MELKRGSVSMIRVLAGSLCLVMLLVIRPAWAEERHPAAAALASFAEDAIAMLSDQEVTKRERTDSFRRLLVAAFDLDTISRFVLGRSGRGLDAAQRQEFRDVFEDYIVASYADRLGGYAGETMSLGRTRVLKKGMVSVGSTIITPGDGEPIRVDWRMRDGGEGWQVLDVLVEGVSMAITQRDEFQSVIRRDGNRIDGLMEMMRKKADTLSALD
jgi:phospholipid transport system substrate-binding protein